MFSIIDQLNRKVSLCGEPKRIVSLVPSITELLYELGLEDNILGITNYCVHPPSALKTKMRIGGVRGIDVDKLLNLKPDLIIANKHENNYEEVNRMARLAPVYVSNINKLEDALRFIEDIGTLTGRIQKSKNLTVTITREFESLCLPIKPIDVLYLIWKAPYVAAGHNSFIHDIMMRAGFKNSLGRAYNTPYPRLGMDEIKEIAPSLLLLPSEPYTYTERDVEEIQNMLPGSRLLHVDGEMFCWFGSRLQYAPNYLKKLQKVL